MSTSKNRRRYDRSKLRSPLVAVVRHVVFVPINNYLSQTNAQRVLKLGWGTSCCFVGNY
jgi:hypothetical protein